MKRRIFLGSAAVALAFTVLGCSSAHRDEQPHAGTVAVAAPLQIQPSRPLPLEPPPLQEFKLCKLGQSCMAMDDRPFEPCLVTTARCADKIEPILVDGSNGTPMLPNSSHTVSHTPARPAQ